MFIDCEKDVDKMIDESSIEHLQPMKEKMEHFISHVKNSLYDVNTKLSSTQEQFNKVPIHHYPKINIVCVYYFLMQVVEYYSVVPKSGEDHVTISHFFGLWSKFSHDLRREWQQQQKRVAKQRASSMRRDKSMVLKKPVAAGGLVSNVKLLKEVGDLLASTLRSLL